MKTLLSFTVSDTLVLYRADADGHVELDLAPSDMPPAAPAPGREEIAPVAEARVRGDGTTGNFASGRTMRFGDSQGSFRLRAQDAGDHRVTTVLANDEGLELVHTLSWNGDVPVFAVRTAFRNGSGEPVMLEALTSFILGGIAGYIGAEAHDRFVLHRYRSYWSAEARHVEDTFEDLAMERSWGGHGFPRCERFGQVGTMPVRGYHPFIAVEDREERVFWGAQLAWTGSWQMEAVQAHADAPSIDGGLADFEFGHWRRTVAPGETFEGPEAFLACRKGTFDGLCQRLLAMQEARLDVPACEEDLPVVFNEWCTSWGNPREADLLAIADRLKGTPVRYLVIDAGWYKEGENGNWACAQGDWKPTAEYYPDGIRATADRIRERGLIPGIWFEAEVDGVASHAFHDEEDIQLKRDGKPIQVGTRRFLDLQTPGARRKLDGKVAQFLRDNHFGYIKIDYNETIGIGSDHPDSLGEGLRRQVEGTHWFFRRLREVNPDLVVESCASGGHRLEPAMFALSSMSSFSDAHEEPEIPVIAANLHNLMLPRQCQVWAVLRPEQSDIRLRYLLGGGMLGRLCISGTIAQLSERQWAIALEGMDFYNRIKGVIKKGESAIFPDMSHAWRRLRGSLSLRRIGGEDGREAVVYHFAFNDAAAETRIPMPEGGWSIAGRFGDAEAALENGSVVFRPSAPMTCCVVHLRR